MYKSTHCGIRGLKVIENDCIRCLMCLRRTRSSLHSYNCPYGIMYKGDPREPLFVRSSINFEDRKLYRTANSTPTKTFSFIIFHNASRNLHPSGRHLCTLCFCGPHTTPVNRVSRLHNAHCTTLGNRAFGLCNPYCAIRVNRVF